VVQAFFDAAQTIWFTSEDEGAVSKYFFHSYFYSTQVASSGRL
jgi:hypothetical protein